MAKKLASSRETKDRTRSTDKRLFVPFDIMLSKGSHQPGPMRTLTNLRTYQSHR
ncbi:hypothetical protein [Paenibacillus sp. BT-177]|uniref:hypothetical protein n=1 Tax=Paenibacillus sp. BT-177 TaxID=2986930 RepID=UPI0021F72752|nr:hypothetical protein [Paenibacillus sp. BT-177]